jgi:hypothetical protein
MMPDEEMLKKFTTDQNIVDLLIKCFSLDMEEYLKNVDEVKRIEANQPLVNLLFSSYAAGVTQVMTPGSYFNNNYLKYSNGSRRDA